MTIEAGFINTPEAQQAAIDQRNIIANKAEVGVIRENQFSFFAAFDGTSNSYIPSNGDPQNTNVAQLYDQVRAAALDNPNLAYGYAPGPGTEGTLTASAWLSPQVTKQVVIAAENMYASFNQAAANWIKNNPDPDVRANPGKYISISGAAFSRGQASFAIFSQLVAGRGVTDPETGKVLISPGEVGISAGIVFDSVTTGVNGNLAFANSENILMLEAENEYRYLFKSTDYSVQDGVQVLEVAGNHCNVGGCYDNSLGALYLEGATKFLQLSGLSIANVDPSRQFDPTERMVIYDEVGDYDSTGHLVRQWDTSGTYTTGAFSQPERLIDHNAVVTPAATSYMGTTETETFTMYNGAKISNIRTIADTPVGNISTTDASNLINGGTTGATTDSLSGLMSGNNANTPFFSGSSATSSSFGDAALVRAIAGVQSGNESWGGQVYIEAGVVGMNIPAQINPAASYGASIASAIQSQFYGSSLGIATNSFFNTAAPSTNIGQTIYINIEVYGTASFQGANSFIYNMSGASYSYGFGFPIVLDLNQNGIELINQDQSTAFFDYTDSGYRMHTGWVSGNDGFLTFDSNHNGKIDQAKELVLSVWTENSTDTDLDALKAVFDTNHDNILNAQDENFSDFKVWQDKNSDGVSDDGELKTLAEIGITSLSLNSTNINWSLGGNKVQSLGQFTWSDGTTSTFADAGLGHDVDGWKIEEKTGYRLLTKADGTTYAIASGASGLTMNAAQSNLNSAIGGAGADVLSTTGSAAVMLQGKDGNDVITGGSGDDWLEGGAGADIISGGAGDDTIFIDASDNLSNISGGAGSDTLVIQGNVGINVNLTNLGMEYGIGGDGNDNLSVSRTNIHPNFQSTILYGSAGEDVLSGAAGNDILSGGAGNDILYGDWGQDTYIFNKGDGHDTIYDYTSTTINYVDYSLITGTYTSAQFALLVQLVGPGFYNVWYDGKDRLQQLSSITSGNAQDILRMGNDVSYSDILIENSGNNLLVGIRQDGIASISNLSDYVTITNWNSSQNRVEYIQFYDGKKLSIENIFIGTSGANVLTGNSSDNLLSGLEGADTMSGGLGNDIYTVDNSNDLVNELANQGTDLVESTITYSLTANVESLILIGSVAIDGTGNPLNNVITGNRNDNVLNGGDGVDTLIGGDGNDTYIVDTTTDIITETATGGIDTVQSSVTYALGSTSNLENLTLTGSAAINAVGNVLNNVLIGNSANNTLDAGAGNDTLNGGDGVDTLIGGDDNDTYIVDTLTDIITETVTGGVDTVLSSVTYTLGPSSNLENLALTGAAVINGTGNALNNVIIGNDAANILDGGLGVDTLIGGDGNDTYIVDTLTDIITETATGGVDTVQSSVTYTLGASSNLENLTLTGNSSINATGNALNNVITGNSASNILNGGIGNDTYVLNAGFGQDLIIDTDSTADNIDTIQFGAGVNSAITQVSRSGNNLVLTVGSNVATLENWFTSATNQIEQIKFADNPSVVWDVNSIMAMVNTAPTAESTTLTINEDATRVININDFGFTDEDIGNTLQSVTITTLPEAGRLLLNGIAVIVNQIISATSINSGLLTFEPVANESGVNYASVGFKVSDGTTLSTSAYTLTVNVTAVNDAPTATNLSTTEHYINNVPINLKDIVVTDVDSTEHTVILTLSDITAGSLSTGTSGSVTSTYNPNTGEWIASGATASVNALLADLTFIPATNYTESFEIATSVSDGIAPAVTGTKSFDSFENNAPMVTNINTSEDYTEDVALNLTDMIITDTDSDIHTVTLTLSDVAAGSLNTATSGSVTSTYDANTGVWTATGETASVNALLADLTFIPAANFNGNFTIATNVSDGVATVTGSKCFSGIAVNDPATVSNLTSVTSYIKNEPYNFEDFVITDIDSTELVVGFVFDETAGSLSADTYGDVSLTYLVDSGWWIAQGDIESLNDLLASLVFTPASDYQGLFVFNIVISDGFNEESAIYFTKLMVEASSNIATSGNDFLIGTLADDEIRGLEGDDILIGLEGDDILDGGAGTDILLGGDGNDTYLVDTDSDQIYEIEVDDTETDGIDTVVSSVTYTLDLTDRLENLYLAGESAINGTGNAVANFLLGNAANNILTDITGGNDILQGLGGIDTLDDTSGNNLLDGGVGADAITAGSGSDLIIGGQGNDTITTGTGYDVLMFNKGDGTDTINASVGTDNTLSLGGNFAYSDLSLTKSANDLILKVGASDQITFKNWYSTSANSKSVLNMQVIAEAMQGFNEGGSDILRDNKVETFNFANLVAAFDTAGATANWQLTDARLTAHLSAGSDTAAIGGDIAYQYGKTGSLTGVGLLAAQAVINNASVGQTAQAFNDPSSWAAETIKLS